MTRRIILDCDPGHDDAVALVLAQGNPEIELAAVTTVAGNQTLANVTRNARAVATLAGITGVPIAAGCDRPLVREQVVAGDIHGETGLDGATLPEPTVELDPRHAVDVIIETVLAGQPGEITLVPTAPLTNIAVALRREPRIVSRVREVVLMGGAYTRGNMTPAAEFNIGVDPEAAAIVFGAGWPVTMIGLDLTHQALATPDVLERIDAIGTPLAVVLRDLLVFFRDAYLRDQGMPAPPVHDPCAVARLIAPEIMRVREAFVAVETQGRWTSGMTVTDFGGACGQPPNALVATTLDAPRFWDLVVDAVARIGG
ncbi:MAG TPA: nucleoside hydrolase [Pseudonocardiaceae bacterium]|nr:nucleoside hydrolase [Pseudonocardiaceae bacterium]